VGFLIFLFWIVGAVGNGFIAQEKGRGFDGCFWMSVLPSPIMVYAYILAVPALPVVSKFGPAWKKQDEQKDA